MLKTIENLKYNLTIKDVKNINLRITRSGEINVSASPFVSQQTIDIFILANKTKILVSINKIKSRQLQIEKVERVKILDGEAIKIFTEISDKIFPYFEKIIKTKPLIIVKDVKTYWGLCHYKKNTITLNKQLLTKPREAIEYVILHEYVHFIHHDHQKGFHDTMKKLMPDYKLRKNMLK